MKPTSDQHYRVYVFDPSGEAAPFLAYSTLDRSQAVEWVRQWQTDPQGHAAVIWPIGAPPPARVRSQKGGGT